MEAFKNYFRVRERGTAKIPTEKIGPDSPLIRTVHSVRDQKTGDVGHELRAMSRAQVAYTVNRLFRDAGLNNGKLTPHSLRKYFYTQLVGAGLPESWANLLSGRVAESGAGRAYNLPSLQMLREGYAKASSGLEFHGTVEQPNSRNTGVKRPKESKD